MKDNKPRNLKTTDELWDEIKKISRYEHRSLNEQINYFLKNSCREFRKNNPEFDNSEDSADRKTVKELAQIIKESRISSFTDKPKILLIDDSYIENMIYKEYLESHNCEVFLAFNEDTALELTGKIPGIDIAIIDYRLPEMTADQLLEKMQKINNSFDSIIVTSDIRPFIRTSFGNCDPEPYAFIEKSADNLEILIKEIQKKI
ncbi:response regulator [Spirochaeta isovalerica]|uniref:CheY-like chemotaxis protein n=1 Tax=Spirochaeta isovalerica TaxID=150 RepID=A0A841R8F1_9SPIO|nr:CheY-like chemotaxis protein [Spirochaeta isovalerica]